MICGEALAKTLQSHKTYLRMEKKIQWTFLIVLGRNKRKLGAQNKFKQIH